MISSYFKILKSSLRKNKNNNLLNKRNIRKYTSEETPDGVEKRSPISLSGIFASIPTPFNQNGEIVLSDLEAIIGKLADSPLSGLAVLGSTGEFYSLSLKEKTDILTTVKKTAHAKMQLLAGTGSSGIKETVELTHIAQDLGYDSALVAPSYIFSSKLSDLSLESYYLKIADDVEIPIFLYNDPNSGVILSSQLIKKLAQHPNIAGIIERGPVELLSTYASETKGLDFTVVGGSATTALFAFMSGANAIVTEVGNVLPEELSKIYEHYTAKQYEEAAASQKYIGQFCSAISRFGVPGLKYVMNKMGFKSGHPRLPLLPLNEHEKLILDNLFQQYKL